ncbi:MAG: hypothetical protein ACM3PY_11870 [Omnitrophica WOR_2 bacterium]
MIVTGIAHDPTRLNERGYLPSTELVYLASKALRAYQVKKLITSLNPGWDQALAKAAQELKIPYVVAIPYPGRDGGLKRDAQVLYYDLLARSDEVFRISEEYCDSAMLDCHCWRVDESDLVMALWDYEFEGETFDVIDYALKHGKEVANLWKDWSNLYTLRNNPDTIKVSSPDHPKASRGARIYPPER